MTMKFRFSALYAEVDAYWEIHHELFKMLRKGLDELEKKIIFFEEVIKADYYLDITFTATRKNSELVINGPVVAKKSKSVEFVPHIPYVDCMNYEDQVSYVLENLQMCLNYIFKKYDSDFSGIPEAFEEVKKEFLNAKEKYTINDK